MLVQGDFFTSELIKIKVKINYTDGSRFAGEYMCSEYDLGLKYIFSDVLYPDYQVWRWSDGVTYTIALFNIKKES